MNRLYGTAIGELEGAMRFRLARQGVLASNVANADTPGYRRTDVSFERALQAAQGLTATHPGHATKEAPQAYRVSRGPRGTRPDGNGVDRDQEVLHMTRNAGGFKEAATVLARIYAMRRIAATGKLS